MVPVKLQTLRSTLYELLLAAHNDDDEPMPEIKANQMLGVNMTKAVQREGVNIIQVQNVKAIGKITNQAVQALREVDALEAGYTELTVREEPALIEYKPTVAEALKSLCTELAKAGCSLQDAAHVIKYGVAMATLELYGGNADRAGEMLGVKPGYVKSLRNRMPDIIREEVSCDI